MNQTVAFVTTAIVVGFVVIVLIASIMSYLSEQAKRDHERWLVANRDVEPTYSIERALQRNAELGIKPRPIKDNPQA